MAKWLKLDAIASLRTVFAARRYAQRGLRHRAVSARPSVCLPRSCTVSKEAQTFPNPTQAK